LSGFPTPLTTRGRTDRKDTKVLTGWGAAYLKRAKYVSPAIEVRTIAINTTSRHVQFFVFLDELSRTSEV
jgi:hypothetical protein